MGGRVNCMAGVTNMGAACTRSPAKSTWFARGSVL